jgi:hypothetical protein
MTSVADVLSQAGVQVSEAEFARLVHDVLQELGPPPARDPRSALSPAEIAALEAVGADLRSRGRREPDPRSPVAATYATVLAETLSVNDVAGRLGIDSSRVRHRLSDRKLLGIRRTEGWRLPTWQFGADGRPLPGFERVLRALPPGTHPVVIARFFSTPQAELVINGAPVSAREWLAGGGDPAVVAELAAGVAFVA